MQLDHATLRSDSGQQVGAGWRGYSFPRNHPALFGLFRDPYPKKSMLRDSPLSLSDIGEHAPPNYFLIFSGTGSENTVQLGCSYPRIRVQIGFEYGSSAGVA
jgi:hypothetical protein